ncbi:MAG: class I SAM-dependent methyltransferase [Methanobacterium paludis]|nr:class I SAM-dependent methyltransferase [Methanobacterium paludis]
MKQNLKGISETLLIPLWARAVEAKYPDPIIKDVKAAEIMEEIEYDFARLDKEWPTQISVVVRTEILDNATKTFINNHPDAVIINIGCGLDTRFFRLDNGQIQWYDLDLPEPITIRRKFFDETDRYKMIAKSVFDYSWIDDIIDDLKKDKKSILIIAEGILMYFTEKEVKNLINKLATSFSGAEMLIETTSPALVKQSQKQDLIKNQYQIDATLHWGIKRGKWIEKLNNRIKFIAEWHYFDYHRDRWKAIRWLALIPPFKNRFGNRIVHLSFIPL